MALTSQRSPFSWRARQAALIGQWSMDLVLHHKAAGLRAVTSCLVMTYLPRAPTMRHPEEGAMSLCSYGVADALGPIRGPVLPLSPAQGREFRHSTMDPSALRVSGLPESPGRIPSLLRLRQETGGSREQGRDLREAMVSAGGGQSRPAADRVTASRCMASEGAAPCGGTWGAVDCTP